MANLKYLFIGTFFGLLLTKAEIISWWRIQEMFRFDSFHMYGVIGSAVTVGIVGVMLLKASGMKSFTGDEIKVNAKFYHKGVIYGGLLFGVGWSITGACPGPMLAQIGSGLSVILVTFLSAVLGTWTYGYFRDRLPH